MTAGLHLEISVVRKLQGTDDSVGGATFTETTVVAEQPATIFAIAPTQQSLEQGLEVNALYTLTTRQSNITQGTTIEERDEVLVTWPLDSQYYNLRFRVVGIQPGKRRAKYAAQHYTLSRIRDSRSQQ